MSDSSDVNELAEAVGRLNEANRQLASELSDAKFDLRAARIARVIWTAIVAIPIIFACTFGIWVARSAIVSSQAVQYCYIDRHSIRVGSTEVFDGSYDLVGVREWRENLLHGNFPKLQDATWAAKELGCPLHPEK
jgi:hypothetical protein